MGNIQHVPDLLIPLSAMSALSILAAGAALIIARKSRRMGTFLAIVAVLLLLLHAMVWGDSLMVARALPIPDVIIYGNIQPLAAGLLAGLAWSLLRTPVWQRIVLVAGLTLAVIYRVFFPFVGQPPPTLPDRWTDGVCRQSTNATCSPAGQTCASKADCCNGLGCYGAICCSKPGEQCGRTRTAATAIPA